MIGVVGGIDVGNLYDRIGLYGEGLSCIGEVGSEFLAFLATILDMLGCMLAENMSALRCSYRLRHGVHNSEL